MSVLKWINIGLRGTMEAGIVFAFAYLGYHTGTHLYLKVIYLVLFPLVGFGFWGLVNFQGYGKLSEYLRLSQELIITGLAALALYFSGLHFLGFLMAALSIIHHSLLYILGDKLLKKQVT